MSTDRAGVDHFPWRVFDPHTNHSQENKDLVSVGTVHCVGLGRPWDVFVIVICPGSAKSSREAVGLES